MIYDLTIVPIGKFGLRGEKYDITFDGEILSSGYSPEFAACRELAARGFSGMARFWRAGKLNWDLTIPVGSKKTVTETAKIGPRLGKYVPFEKPEAWGEA